MTRVLFLILLLLTSLTATAADLSADLQEIIATFLAENPDAPGIIAHVECPRLGLTWSGAVVRASSSIRSECSARLVQTFWPLITYSSPSRSMRDSMFVASDEAAELWLSTDAGAGAAANMACAFL